MSRISSSRRASAGFTLIELLVVIAIIAILAAILFPVFAQAREKARQSSCLSNMKQLGTSILMYVQDYDETFPSGRVSPTDSAAQQAAHYGQGWGAQVYAYVKNYQVYKCPDDATPNTAATGAVPTLYPVSYFFNYNISRYASALAAQNAPANTVLLFEGAADPVNLSVPGELPSSATPMFSGAGDGLTVLTAVDAGTAGTARFDTGYLGGYASPPTPGYYKATKGRHAGSAIYQMGDGHAKYIQSGAVSPGLNALAPTDGQNMTTFRAAGTSASGFGATFSTN